MDRNPDTIRWVYSAELGADTIPLDNGNVLDKLTILRSLARHFRFPDYFGANWDAAYDLLLDYVDRLETPAVWRFGIGSGTCVNLQDLDTWLQLMADVGTYAQDQGQPVQIEVHSERALD